MKTGKFRPNSGSSFPVVFFNGQNEIDAGNIFIHPSLNYTQFKVLIARLIGNISPRNISTFLVRRTMNSSRPPNIIPSMIAINDSFDFAAISFEHDCLVFAAMKPPRPPGTQIPAVRSRTPVAEPGPGLSHMRRSSIARSFRPDELHENVGWERRIYVMEGEPPKAEVAPAAARRELCENFLAAEEDGRDVRM